MHQDRAVFFLHCNHICISLVTTHSLIYLLHVVDGSLRSTAYYLSEESVGKLTSLFKTTKHDNRVVRKNLQCSMCDRKFSSVKPCRVHGQRHIGVFVCLCGGFFASTDTIGKHYKICSIIRSLPTRKGEDSFRYLFVDEENYAKFTRTLRIDNQHLQLNFAQQIPVGVIVETRSVVNQAPVEPNTSVIDLRQPVLTLTDCLINRRISSPPTPQGRN